MTDLNEYECEMLDVMLEAFGVPDNLTREQILQLFDYDEASAFAMVSALLREELVVVAGAHGIYELPDRLILKPKGEKFLKEGGFTRRYQLEQQKPLQVGGTQAKLQQHNMKLQNQKLEQQTEIINLKKSIESLRMRQYLWWALILVALIVGYFTGHK
ncbi:hypothetical protein [Mucilaginibacter terrae]|uniref:Uncharacterized protein n=1 Tax=Mucilaginibacter terrae TaxID=1955052 RepID=A0ABU3GQF6_9SPHI|nr:hypothetical protein [Mucilaginibacter terrae]MDT3401860.1 hypothetical protein [Mucilaginibacter terrae]